MWTVSLRHAASDITAVKPALPMGGRGGAAVDIVVVAPGMIIEQARPFFFPFFFLVSFFLSSFWTSGQAVVSGVVPSPPRVRAVQFFIRAKRVSNCYMQEKKKLTVCVSGCSANLGFSVEKLSWF